MQSHVTKPTLMVNFSTTVSTRGHPKLKLRYRLPSGDSKTKSCNGSPYPTINEAFQPPNKGYRGSISSSDCKEKVLVTICEKTFYFFFFLVSFTQIFFSTLLSSSDLQSLITTISLIQLKDDQHFIKMEIHHQKTLASLQLQFLSCQTFHGEGRPIQVDQRSHSSLQKCCMLP